MGIKVRVKRNIGKDSEEYFGKPNGKVYELTDNFRLVDDGDYEWGNNGFKDEQEFIEYMKNVISSSTEFEVVREKSKWKCVELNGTSGFTEGRIYEVVEDGIIYYDSGNESSEKLSINGNEAKCWRAKFKKEEEKVVNKFKVGDIIKGKANNERYGYTNKDMTKGEVVKVNNCDNIEVKILEHSNNSQIGYKYDVESDYFELVTPLKRSIHITLDGNTTHAVVKEGGKVVKREKVGLYSGDVYDEATGVREVIDKLYGKKTIENVMKEKEAEPKTDTTTEFWRCVWKGEDCSLNFTVGKVYERRFFNDIMRMDDNKNKNYWVLNPLSEFCSENIRFERVKNKTKSISEYTTDELLSEIKKRMEK